MILYFLSYGTAFLLFCHAVLQPSLEQQESYFRVINLGRSQYAFLLAIRFVHTCSNLISTLLVARGPVIYPQYFHQQNNIRQLKFLRHIVVLKGAASRQDYTCNQGLNQLFLVNRR